MDSGVSCAEHPGSQVVCNGVRGGGRRQRYLCRTEEGVHQFTLAVTEELLGACMSCGREWEHGLPVARGARFVVAQAISLLSHVGGGCSMREAAEMVRAERQEMVEMLGQLTGRVHGHGEGEVSRHGRLAGDWLERYGGPVVKALMPAAWPAGVVAVDAKTFHTGARYPADHPEKPRHPLPYGELRFGVLAAATRGPQGHMRICHIRAVPNDHKPSWVDFFRSLSGKPDTILSDPDPQIDYAIREVWADDPPLHPLSTWHYWEKVIEKFRKARLYPWTDKLCGDAEAAFRDGDSFRSWRLRAKLEAPVAVRSWLKKKGDEVQSRLDGAMAPMTIGDLETFLDHRVGPALATGRGRIQNLRRLDIRLGLIALRQNRQLTTTRLAPILLDALAAPGPRLVPRRSLDGAEYSPGWVLANAAA